MLSILLLKLFLNKTSVIYLFQQLLFNSHVHSFFKQT